MQMNPGSHRPTIIINSLKVALEAWLNEYVIKNNPFNGKKR